MQSVATVARQVVTLTPKYPSKIFGWLETDISGCLHPVRSMTKWLVITGQWSTFITVDNIWMYTTADEIRTFEWNKIYFCVDRINQYHILVDTRTTTPRYMLAVVDDRLTDNNFSPTNMPMLPCSRQVCPGLLADKLPSWRTLIKRYIISVYCQPLPLP